MTAKKPIAFTDREPLVRLAKRDNTTHVGRLVIRVCAGLLGLLIVIALMSGITKFSFSEVWHYLEYGAFDNDFFVNDWLKDTFLLLCISVALAPAFKMKFWNIGAQGQVLIGSLMAAMMMIKLENKADNGTIIFVMLLTAVAAGAVWGLLPALCKVKWNTNETLFTLMMNYIAIQLVACASDIWKGQNSALGTLNKTTEAGYFPELFSNPYGLCFLLVSIVTLFVFLYMRYTKHGYEIAVVGESLNTARYAGINTKKVILRTMALSGALCGLVGALYAGGVSHTLSTSTGGGYGFTAIIVAWSAQLNPIAMIPVAMSIVFFEKGASGIKSAYPDLNSYTSYVLVGIFLFMLIGCEFFINYRFVFNSKLTAFAKRISDKTKAALPKTTACAQKVKTKCHTFRAKVESVIKGFIDKCNAALTAFFDKIHKKLSALMGKLKQKFSKKSAPTDAVTQADVAESSTATENDAADGENGKEDDINE